jgi:hypothetical protein
MELSTTSKHPPKRQDTLGPMSPIQDWEVERATVKSFIKNYSKLELIQGIDYG